MNILMLYDERARACAPNRKTHQTDASSSKLAVRRATAAQMIYVKWINA